MTAMAGEMRRAPAAGAPGALVVFLAALAAAVAVALLRGVPEPGWLLAGQGNDSAMRLVVVRDLMAGQGWLDPVQPRLGPGGTVMHWSRLVDAPIAALILLFEPLAGRAGAEHAALVLWPLLALSACTAAAHGIGRALGGASAGLLAALCTFLALVVGSRFSPGDIDHHNVQLALLLCALAGALSASRAAQAAGGLAMAASICVGVETLPLLAALGAGLALLWALGPARWRDAATALPLGLAGGLAALFGLTAPPAAWRGGFCDAVSADLAVPVIAGALLLAACASALSRAGAGARFGALALGGAVLGAATAAFLPACLSNPYDALDPWLVARWLSLVEEAKGLPEVLEGRVAPAIAASFAVGALALAAALGAAASRRDGALALLALLVGVALAMSSYQIRSSLYVIALSAVAFGALAGMLRDRSRGARAPIAGICALLCIALPLPAVWGTAMDLVAPAPAGTARDGPAGLCAHPGAWDALAARPAGMVAASTDLGSAILRDTHHSVLAAPYHRNEAGMTAQLRIALAPDPEAALALLREHGADHVAICAGSPELRALSRRGHVGFFHALAAGEVPDWLSPLPGVEESDLRVFALR